MSNWRKMGLLLGATGLLAGLGTAAAVLGGASHSGPQARPAAAVTTIGTAQTSAPSAGQQAPAAEQPDVSETPDQPESNKPEATDNRTGHADANASVDHQFQGSE